jgi:hypothetical protein
LSFWSFINGGVLLLLQNNDLQDKLSKTVEQDETTKVEISKVLEFEDKYCQVGLLKGAFKTW